MPTPLERAVAIIDRLKVATDAARDSDLADALGVNRANVANWKKRGTIPWEQMVLYCLDQGISLEWLVHGRGPQRVDVSAVAEPGAIYHVQTNQDAVYRIAAQVHIAVCESGKDVGAIKFEHLVRFLHREMLDTGASEVPIEKIYQLVHLL